LTLIDHAASQLTAIWNMIFNKPGWQAEIDHSINGVFRSLWSFTFCLPIIIVNSISLKKISEKSLSTQEFSIQNTPEWTLIALNISTFYLDWIASIFVLTMIAKNIGAHDRIADIIVSYNWLQLPFVAILAIPLTLLATTGSTELAGLLTIPAVAFQLVALWGFTQQNLYASSSRTIAIITLLFLIGMLTSLFLEAIFSVLIDTDIT